MKDDRTNLNGQAFWLNNWLKSIPYVEYDIVSHCNLNCNGCTHYSPLAKPWFANLDEFKRDFTQLKKLFKHINKIRIMGGEPFLHPQLKDFLIEIRRLFPKSRIDLVSNGLLINQHPEILKITEENRIYVIVTDYRVLKNKDILKNLKYHELWHRGLMYNLSLDPKGEQDQHNSFLKCMSRIYECNYLKNGRLYHCAPCALTNRLNEEFNIDLPKSKGISIYENNAGEIINYLYNNPPELCKYCNVNKWKSTEHPPTKSKKDIREWVDIEEEK